MPEPIQSNVGHGALGMRSGLRDFNQLAAFQSGTPQLWAEIALGVPVQTNWEANSGVYRTSFYRNFDGIRLDVVGVLTANQRLRRVESIAACAATAGTYYYDLDSNAPNLWDSGLTWDGSSFWDEGSWLYVNAPAADLTADDVVIVRVGFYAGTDGVTQPVLGPDILTDGSFEVWTDPGTLTHWTFDTDGGGNLQQQSAYLVDGAFAPRVGGLFGFSPRLFQDNVPAVVGAIYCLSGRYLPFQAPGFASAMSIQVSTSGAETGIVQSDGRTTGGAGVPPLSFEPDGFDSSADPATNAQFRRFCFYFIAPVAALRVCVRCTDGTITSNDWVVDDLKLQRVHRWVRYEPRLARGAAPTIDEGREDIYFGQWAIGQAQLALANEGLLETLLGLFEPVGGEVILRQGGRFHDAEELTLEACRTVFVGRIQDADLDQSQARLSLENTQGQLQAIVPLRTFDASETPDADARIQGQPRPMLFGYQTGIPPRRISRTDGGLGVYEVADCVDAAAGIGVSHATTARYAEARLFQDDQAAQAGDLALSTDVTDHVAFDPITGRFTALKCLKPVLIDEEHQFYTFTINGGAPIDIRLLDANEETLVLTPTGTGANNNFGPIGAPTIHEAVATLGDSAHAHSTSTSGNRRCEVTCAAISGSAAIISVEHRAWITAAGGVYEDGDRFRFYVERGGTRYYSPYVDEPRPFYFEHTHKWLTDPSTGVAWTEAGVNAITAHGVEYDPNGVDYLKVDTLVPYVRRNKTAAPTASRPSIRSPKQHAAMLQQAMLSGAVLASGLAVTFDETTFKYTIVGSGAVTTLVLNTKDGRQKSGWAAMGWGTDANKTGSLSYTSDVAYYDPETEIDTPVLRVAAVGYVDDAAGTYTGTPGLPIERAPDVLRFLLLRLLRVDPDRIDEGTFTAARLTAKSAAIYIDKAVALAQVVQQIEQGEQADLIIDGDRYYFAARPTAWAAGGVELRDADFIGGVRSKKASEGVYALVRVTFGRDPGRGTEQTYEIAPAGNPRLRFARNEPRTFETYLLNPGDAAGVRDAMAALAAAPKRMYELRVRGQLSRVRLEQIVRLHPVTGGMSNADGAVAPVDVRLLKRTTDPYTLESTATAVEV